jgi:hypothetical protein
MSVFIAIAAVFVAIPAHAQVVHRVHVGGPDACEGFGLEPGCDANFSLVALEFADGRVTGNYVDRFAEGAGFHAVIDCVAIDGNEAWVSGTIVTGILGNGFDLTGFPVLARVRDNGTSPRDA